MCANIDSLFSWWVIAKRYSSPEAHSEYHSSASQLASNLVNVRSIAAHFHPKINSWSTSNQVTSITPEQVLHIACVVNTSSGALTYEGIGGCAE